MSVSGLSEVKNEKIKWKKYRRLEFNTELELIFLIWYLLKKKKLFVSTHLLMSICKIYFKKKNANLHSLYFLTSIEILFSVNILLKPGNRIVTTVPIYFWFYSVASHVRIKLGSNQQIHLITFRLNRTRTQFTLIFNSWRVKEKEEFH